VRRGAAAEQRAEPRAATPSREPSRIVELCGLPGSGKSHVAAALARALRARGAPVRAAGASIRPDLPPPLRLSRKLAAAAAGTLAEPGATMGICAAVARSQATMPARASRSLQWIVTQQLLRRARRGSGVQLLDEGVIQAMWSVGLRGDVERVIEALDSEPAWLGPDVLVVVHASVATAERRLAGRASAHSRTQRLLAGDRVDELERGERLLGGLVTWWRRSAPAGASVVELANDDDSSHEAELSDLAERVLR
jgi:AAA domain